MKGKILRLLYQPYKWLIYLPLFVLSTVFFIGLGLLIILFSGPDAANRVAGRGWARFNCRTAPVRVTVVGREHIVQGQSYVVVANHQSVFDIFVLWGFLGIDARWVMKKELQKVPLFGMAGRLGGNVFIDRKDGGRAYESLGEAGNILVNGVSLIMLPEGTRSRSGELGEFKKGAFVMSVDLGIPLLPVSIVGTGRILPPKTLNLFPGRAVLVIHEPVNTAGRDAESLQDLILSIRGTIRKGIEDYARTGA